MSDLTEQEITFGDRLLNAAINDANHGADVDACGEWLYDHAPQLLAAARDNLTLRAELADARAEIDLLRAPVSPSNLRDLGKYLARLLDEDQWPSAERLLNAALSEQHALRAELAQTRAERDALLADKERLNWLNDWGIAVRWRMGGRNNLIEWRTSNVRDAIDAARAKDQSK